jgi:hypothetical protein
MDKMKDKMKGMRKGHENQSQDTNSENK